MVLILLLRILLYLQLILGAIRYLSPGTLSRSVWDLHLGFGVLIAALALFAFRPRLSSGGAGIELAARFMPLLPLALGLGFRLDLFHSGTLVLLHIVLALLTIAAVEMAAARRRRLV